MTCAHVVDVALRKVAGVDTVKVGLNRGVATVKLKPGNTVSVPQLWEVIHKSGYTPKSTAVLVRGDVVDVDGQLRLNVSGTKERLTLAASAKNPLAYSEAVKKVGKSVVVQGVMEPGKDLKAEVPLQVSQVK